MIWTVLRRYPFRAVTAGMAGYPPVDDLQHYRDEAVKRAVPEPIIEWWLPFARSQAVLRRAGDDLPSDVAGHYGGHPSLPEDVVWSGFPDFVGSVDCAALPGDAADISLPKDGHLLFFANKAEPDWGPGPEDNNGRVVYVPAGTPTSERVPADRMDYVSEPFPLQYAHRWTLPSDYSDFMLADEERKSRFDQYGLGWLAENYVGDGEITLGGYSCAPQDDPCLARWPDESGAEAWLLLAQAGYKFDGFMDGILYWMIRQEDLAARRFDRTKLLTQIFE
jgi:hypothetical protein